MDKLVWHERPDTKCTSSDEYLGKHFDLDVKTGILEYGNWIVRMG